MIKLLKYELLRKKKVYVIALCILTVLMLLIAFGIPRLQNNYWVLITTVSALILLVGGLLFPIIINIAKYYSEYKNRSGYMMFLTPNSGSKIFGSKVLAAIIDTLAIYILLGLCALISYSIVQASYAEIPQISQLWAKFKMAFPNINLGTVVTVGVIAALIQNINTIILALFSITVSKTMLAHKPLNWFIPLIMFFVISWVEQMVATTIIAAANFTSFKELISNNYINIDLSLVLIMAIGISIVFASAYTIISSRLITKKLDL